MYSVGSSGSVKKKICFASSHSKKPVDGTAHRRTDARFRNNAFTAAVSALALITSGPADQQPKEHELRYRAALAGQQHGGVGSQADLAWLPGARTVLPVDHSGVSLNLHTLLTGELMPATHSLYP